MSIVQLENSDLRLVVDPQRGAGTLALHGRIDDQWLPLMPDSRDDACDLACSNFLMVPYSNRIKDGAFAFNEQPYQLQNGAGHAIHGDVRQRPWTVVEQSDLALRCAFDSRSFEGINWPWSFSAEADFILNGPHLILRLSLLNSSGSPMPAGFGWHPYFSRALTSSGEPVHLHFALDGAYPDANDTRIPSGPLQPLAPHQDFSQARALDADNFLDTCYYGFNGGSITWPDSGVRLRLNATESCKHLILYNPTGKTYFAVEPVTNANNGVNLLAQNDPTCGTIALQPGEALTAECTLSLENL
jgi:aldose 1-epimerase